MSLPETNTPWPPQEIAPALEQVRRDAAWLTGDLPAIRDQVNTDRPQPFRSRAQFNGGIVGGMARGMLGKPHIDAGGDASVDRHLPVAAELVATSANLLAEKPPAATLHPDDANNERARQALDELTSSDTFAAEWWEAAYHKAGHGWVYGRVVWNLDVSPSPWIEWVDADQGYAEFTHGKQTAVTFWDTYDDPHGKSVYRLLQRHTPGRIEYALYDGTSTKIGHRVPVTEHPRTAYLADIVDAESGVTTGIDHTTAVMIRNLEKNPAWRTDPTLRYYGRSDVAKAGGLWADIDIAWTSMMHEVESGRSRIMISEELLESGPPGSGSYFDWHRDIFPLAPGGDPDAGGVIKHIQPDLRVDKHSQVVDTATRKAIDAVGLSPITVGMDPQASGEMTATETRARSDKTIKTFGGKTRQARSGLSEILTAYLHMDAQINGYAPPTRHVNVAIVEPVQDTELDQARRLKELRAVNLASIEHGVETLHPEWTPEQHDEEVKRIYREINVGMPADPFDVGGDVPFGGNDGREGVGG